jgi:hypothetical protein
MATGQQRPVKSPSTRLLDLLAGWAAFVSEDEENGIRDAALSAEAIGEIYQLAGAHCAAWDEASRAEAEAAIRQFVYERVMPLILAKEVDAQPDPNGGQKIAATAPSAPAVPVEGLASTRRR